MPSMNPPNPAGVASSGPSLAAQQLAHLHANFRVSHDGRLVAPALPSSAKFQNVAPLLAKYAGEQQGLVFGTKVKYLNSQERQQHQLKVHNGMIYGADGKPFDTRNGGSVFAGGQGKAIFVMDHNGNLYASKNQTVGKFHHSSFLGGAPVAAAGEIEVHNGQIKDMSRRSGHYQPSEQQIANAANHLVSLGVKPTFNLEFKV
jgi:hypothetical protein